MPILYKRRKWKNWGSAYAVFITFIVIGIWHGPRWNFVLLGVFQGLAINYEFFTKRNRIKIAEKFPKKFVLPMSRIITYFFFSFSLIFFYAPKLSDAVYFLRNLIIKNQQILTSTIEISWYRLPVAIIFSILFLWVESREEKGIILMHKFNSMSRWVKWPIYYAMIILIYWLDQGQTVFVYEQF